MRRNIDLMLLASTVIVLSAGAALAQTSAANSPEQPDFTLTIRARQPEVKVGAEIRVEVVTTNTSTESFTVTDGNPPPWAEVLYQTYVRNENGELAPETKVGRIIRTRKDEDHPKADVIFVGSGAPLRELRPGETTIKDEIVLNRLYDLSKPGKYSVQLVCEDSKNPSKTVKSNTITVIVAGQ
jgi:hypothetical protein